MMQKSTPGVTPLKSIYGLETCENRCAEEGGGEGADRVFLVRIAFFGSRKSRKRNKKIYFVHSTLIIPARQFVNCTDGDDEHLEMYTKKAKKTRQNR